LCIAAGIFPGHIEALLLVHERLMELGFDERAAEAVAEALVRAGAVGRRRSRVLAALITLAGTHVDLHDAEKEHERVQQEVVRLEAKCHHLREAVEDLKASVAGLQQKQRGLQKRIARMEAEAATCQSRFAVLAAFESFLQGHVQAIDATGELFDQVRELARKGARPGGGDSVALAADLHEKILQVLAQHYANAGRAV
jgi:predicted nuclease with TOPRIM domain